ncbi:hypothetical protein POJ06DRAFT_271863 [Lipomyces tetrasporus]|uniref:Retrograde transport protein Dsl1 C-terminal domain-containing protein n=1 Tax=Lipomyces tetrasporus TaxID=54092 RepID=A0AAD7QKC9_9ASCO|nr:uncharacterized protein POJ06DRAFT_271863 [Lipomyces tetrasporus]KAJ8096844.1 hypothetical protein POJ06DRAFT_271863 [Lipomyces tetrasporus]
MLWSQEVVHSVLQYLQLAEFPDEVDANLSVTEPESISSVASALGDAIAQIESQIENICSENSRELDNYLNQSKTLFDGIELSEKQAEELKRLSKENDNADETIYALIDECDNLTLSYNRNQGYVEALNQIWFIKATLIELRSCFQSGLLVACVPLLKSAEQKITSFPEWEQISLLRTLNEEVNTLSSSVFHSLHSLWIEFIQFQMDGNQLLVQKALEAEGHEVSLADIAEALKRFDFAGKIIALNTKLKDPIVARILDMEHPVVVEVTYDDCRSSLNIVSNLDAASYTFGQLIENLSIFIKFINTTMPESISHPLAVDLSAIITTQLIDVTFHQSVPLELSEFPKFETVLRQIKEFDKFLQKEKWTRSNELTDWVSRVPSVWYKKKCDSVLVLARQIISEAMNSERKIVEKRGAIVSADAISDASRKRETRRSLPSTEKQRSSDEYDWNEEWDSDDNGREEAIVPETSRANTTGVTEDVAAEDDDGWGFDESLDLGENEDVASGGAGSDPDDWNWGDEEPVQAAKATTPVQAAKKPKGLMPRRTPARGSSLQKGAAMTPSPIISGLNETYVVTAVPQKILDLTQTLWRDANDLATKYKTSSIAPASKNLRSLVSYLLGAFRALAPLHYGDSFDSNLFLSNDCLYLSEQVSAMKDLGADAYLLMEMANQYGSQQETFVSS